MEQIEHDPFIPTLTLGKLLAFDPEKPETYLSSDFVNHFLRVFLRVRAPRIEPIAEIMEMDRRIVAAALKAETGFTFREWREHWEVFEGNLFVYAYGKHYDHDKLAKHLGFYDNSSAWRFKNSARFKKLRDLHNEMARNDKDYIHAMKLGMERMQPILDAREAEILRRVREEMK